MVCLLYVLIVLLWSLILSTGTLIFPLASSETNRLVYINITLAGFNDGEPFQVSLGFSRHAIVDARLFDGDQVADSDGIILTASDGSQILLPGYNIRYPVDTDASGYLGIGPGSVLISQAGHADIVYSSNMRERELRLHSIDLQCMSESRLTIPLVFSDSWNQFVIPLVQFKLIVNGNDGARAILASEPLFPEQVSVSGSSAYLRLPREIGDSLADLITLRGGVGIANDNFNIPISFQHCGTNLIRQLPDIVIAINNDRGEIIGEVIQGPEDYLHVDESRGECSFRFTLGYDGELYSVNPLTLNGLNVRIGDLSLEVCDPGMDLG